MGSVNSQKVFSSKGKNLRGKQHVGDTDHAVLVFPSHGGRFFDYENMGMVDAAAEKNIPHWFDYWGHDSDHDWPWWRKQIAYFLDKVVNE